MLSTIFTAAVISWVAHTKGWEGGKGINARVVEEGVQVGRGWVGSGGGWAARGRLYLLSGLFRVAVNLTSASYSSRPIPPM